MLNAVKKEVSAEMEFAPLDIKVKRPNLLTVDDAKDMGLAEMTELYEEDVVEIGRIPGVELVSL